MISSQDSALAFISVAWDALRGERNSRKKAQKTQKQSKSPKEGGDWNDSSLRQSGSYFSLRLLRLLAAIHSSSLVRPRLCERTSALSISLARRPSDAQP
jgi:hypothetical protein